MRARESICTLDGSKLVSSCFLSELSDYYLSVYNLKRRIVSLPTLTAEIYHEKLVEPQQKSIKEANFSVEKTIPELFKASRDIAKESGQTINDNAVVVPLRCLFYSKHFPDVEANPQQMFKSHGIFIPDQEYLVDSAGLVDYLSRIVSGHHLCLCCRLSRNTSRELDNT
jgi:hypothetical protein